MAANTTPIFPLTPVVGFGKITTANNVYDGTGTQVTLITGGTNGTRLDSFKVKALGTNSQTVLRLFLNNGSDSTIASNNTLIAELTIGNSAANASSQLSEAYTVPLNISIPNGYNLNACIGTTIASGISVTVFGGNY